MKSAGELISQKVASWPGVEALPHRFGGTEYRYRRKEMGHVHVTAWPTCLFRASCTTR